MATLPSSLALTTIADGSTIVAADHRNNYAAIQTENNALLTILGAGGAGDVFTGVGTTVAYAKPPGYEYAYNEFTAAVSVTATTEATANTVVTASAVTFDGATAVIVEFSSPHLDPDPTAATRSLTVCLYDGASSIGFMTAAITPAAAAMLVPCSAKRRLTPSAAAHTYSIRAFVNAGTGSVAAGAGGVGVNVPGFIRITKV